jgi:COMPASS component SWD3
VQVWDIRAGEAVRGWYGPHICGDALDIAGNDVVTGSWRSNEQLEVWDFGTGKRREVVPWYGRYPSSSSLNNQACMLYAAQFSKENPLNPRFIGAGGSGFNEAKVFDRKRGNEVVGSITGLRGGVFAMDFCPTGNAEGQTIAIGGGDAGIRIVDILPQISSRDDHK